MPGLRPRLTIGAHGLVNCARGLKIPLGLTHAATDRARDTAGDLVLHVEQVGRLERPRA
jgi:hypothetical protein